tara:strand:- start:1616 stop:2722 length:1107 start_codon:yes stop_codon:yes gene_type:complete
LATEVIPFFGVKRQYESIRKEILDATDQVYSSGRVLDGFYTDEFERQIAARCHRRYAVSVGSGTQALIFAQKLLFPENSKIIIPTVSFVATLNSVLMAGNTPLFCDTDDQALLNLESMDYALDAVGAAGVMYVNIFGNVIDYDRFQTIVKFFNQDLKVIEDAAQSFGSWYGQEPSGSLGDVSILSFDPTKNLNNYGSGGMVLVDNLVDAKYIMDMRDNGKTNDHEIPGTNSKMSEAECAQMLVKLRHFDRWQHRRHEIADYYTQELSELVDTPKTTANGINSWHKYVIKLADRTGLQHHLSKAGIETKIHYNRPLYEYEVGYPYINYVAELYREASAFCSESLSLPIYPELTDAEVERVVEEVKYWLT